MKQKMLIAGVSRRQGVSKKTGNQYDIANFITLQPLIGTGANFVASGFKAVEMATTTDAAMQAIRLAFPCEIEADCSIRNDGKLQIDSFTAVTSENTKPQSSTKTAA